MVISFVMWSPRSGRNQRDWCLTLQEGCCLSLGVRALPVSFLLKYAIQIDTYLASQSKNIFTIKCPESNKKVYLFILMRSVKSFVSVSYSVLRGRTSILRDICLHIELACFLCQEYSIQSLYFQEAKFTSKHI